MILPTCDRGSSEVYSINLGTLYGARLSLQYLRISSKDNSSSLGFFTRIALITVPVEVVFGTTAASKILL